MLHAWSIWDKECGFDLMLQNSRRALSLFQHHDGVTGTARDHVMKDYARQIMVGRFSFVPIVRESSKLK